MPTGVVRNFKDGQHFCWIRPSGDSGALDLFAHLSEFKGGAPYSGAEVSYVEAPDKKQVGRSCATQIRFLEAA